MYFDAITLAAVADELRATILDGRVQRVRLPSPLTVAKPSRGIERDTPLLLLLRKYVVGGRVVAIEQPPLERVLLLSITKGPPARNTAEEREPDADGWNAHEIDAGE